MSTFTNTFHGIGCVHGGLDGSGNPQPLSCNQDVVVLTSAARTAQTTSASITNRNAKGIVLYLNVTAASGTGGLTPEIGGIDPVTGLFFPIMSFNTAAITATGTFSYSLYPGVVGQGQLKQSSSNSPLPATWAFRMLVGDSSSYTYSVGASVIV